MGQARTVGAQQEVNLIFTDELFNQPRCSVRVSLVVVHHQLHPEAILAYLDTAVFIVYPVQPSHLTLTGVLPFPGVLPCFTHGSTDVNDLLGNCPIPLTGGSWQRKKTGGQSQTGCGRTGKVQEAAAGNSVPEHVALNSSTMDLNELYRSKGPLNTHVLTLATLITLIEWGNYGMNHHVN